jgi:GDP-4-dehydro-6-deoxy-D-mannose reductase
VVPGREQVCGRATDLLSATTLDLVIRDRQGKRDVAVKRVLITGANGFVGGHLVRELRRHFPDATISGTVYGDGRPVGLDQAFAIDLREPEAVRALIADVAPEQIYHLAAQAYVPQSYSDPWDTLENNIRSQVNVSEACLKADIRPRMLIISSAEVYGTPVGKGAPLDESTPFRPNSPYSVSKVAQDLLGLQYFLSHGFPIMRVRPFNHIGPGQNPRFVAPAFAMQIARIEAGMAEPVIYVGNLDAQRDFTDVRDVVRAYRLILERGMPGEAYNLSSGTNHTIRRLLEILVGLARVPVSVEVDPERFRPIDAQAVVSDSTLLRERTGWQPEIPFEQTLLDILEDCRARVRAS